MVRDNFVIQIMCKDMVVRELTQRLVVIPKRICEFLKIPDIITHVIIFQRESDLYLVPVPYFALPTVKFRYLPFKLQKIIRVNTRRSEYGVFIPKVYDIYSDQVGVCLEFSCVFKDTLYCFPYIVIMKFQE